MPKRFKPPTIDKLAEVDVSGCKFKSKCEDIQGLISPSGQGGWDGTEEYRVHCFSLAAWRHVGGPLVRKQLIVLRPASNHNWSAYPKYSICRMRVLLSKDESRAVFAKRLRLSGDDSELHALSYELQQPLVLATKQFGKLTLDRGIDWFCGKARWNGRKVDINFPTDGGESIDGGLATAELLWKRQAEWKRKVDGFAVQELLPIKNEHWLSEGEKPLTPKQFRARMTLDSISVSNDGQFEFWHSDGDMFYGHSIQVCGSLRGGLTRADIPG